MGIFTFIFTDIEGSTALFERAGSAYTSALQQHFSLLREQLAQHGGREFKNSGDGLLAVFEDSRAAIACAIGCQRALGAARWPAEVDALRVRIGLHRGEATPEEGDFRGLAMHHAARVLDAAHGGQILCSATVFADLPARDREALSDLGLYRLRGVPEPVRIYHVDSPELPNESFPALRIPPAFTHRIPVPPTRFFGRAAEIEELAALLAPSARDQIGGAHGRLITLHGPGGTGKTRLSLAVAERLLRAYSHAVWFVPLAEIRDAALLPETLREALALPPDPAVDPLDRAVAMLAAQPALLILDNFEQLVPAGVETVRMLLERVPDLALLVSSRVRLALSAERAFDLAPLHLPAATAPVEELLQNPSVQLFVDRARAARHTFACNEVTGREVAEVCLRLEGIPLAIELAAARASVLTPRQMLERLTHRLDFLVGGKADFAHRHRTLRAAVSWSYELLSGRLRCLFRHLSVFRGGWTLEAAEAIATNAPGTLFEEVIELENGSLIVAEEHAGVMRYRMLEVIREFAAEQLAAEGETAAAMAEHHAYYYQLVSAAPAPGKAERFELIETEHDNLRAVLDGDGCLDERATLAVALRDFWMVRGHFTEGRRRLQQLADAHPTDSVAAAVVNAAGILAWKSGDLAGARVNFEAALAILATVGDERRRAGALNNLGIVAADQDDLAASRDFYEQSLGIYRRIRVPSELAAVLSNLGEILIATGDYPAARAALEESLAIQQQLGEQLALANTLHNLADLHCEFGDAPAARQHLARSLQIRHALGSRDDLPASWITLARVALLEGHSAPAATFFAAAEAAFRALEVEPPPAHQARLTRDLDPLRTTLGNAAFAAAWERGRTCQLASVLTPEGAWANGLDPTAHPSAI